MNKNFTLLLTGHSIANIGDVLYMVSIISTIFILTGSATLASFVPFTITTAMFISNLLTPLLVGRVNLKWILAGSQIGKTLFIMILGRILIVITEANFYLIFIIIGIIALLDGCSNPIRQTLIPHYVNSNELVKANGIAETTTQFIQTTMWFIGSLSLIAFNSQQIVQITTILFIISSLLLCFLSSVNQQLSEHKSKIEQIIKGWKTLFKIPVLRKIALIDFLDTIAGTVWVAAILYVFVNEALAVDEKWWGFINGAFFLGLIIGSLYCIKNSSYLEKKLGKVIFIGSLLSSIVTVLFSILNNPYFALLMSVGVGVFSQIKNIPQQTVIQTSTIKENLANIYTSLNAIATGVFGISSLIMGGLADLLGVRMVYIFSSVLLFLVSITVLRNKHLFIRNILD